METEGTPADAEREAEQEAQKENPELSPTGGEGTAADEVAGDQGESRGDYPSVESNGEGEG